MKQRQIKIYSFGRTNIEGNIISSENLEENKVTLTDNFLFYAFECYINKKLENGQFVDEFIKVMLPNTEEAAKLEWENGLTFNDHKYYAWLATTGGMKKEGLGKCETIFVREDYKAFSEEFENLISLGKFKEIEESKEERCINKDILSRISLSVSSCNNAGDMPNFIVLPQPQYRIIKDYKTVEKYATQVNDKEQIDYKLIDYHFDKEIDVFDGGGIATPNVFSQIKEELGVKYPIEFAIIRAYGLGIKGMITKFDIVSYLDKYFTGDTEFCRKVDGKYQFLDMWKDWQTVTDKTILLNDSMVKLGKFHKDMADYKRRLSNVDEKYKGIIDKLYVTKINKEDKDIQDYRRLNYQLLSALALSKKDYLELIREDGKVLRQILKPFIKEVDENGKDSWVENLNAIRLFFKNIINEETDEEIKQTTSNVVNKTEELLNISEDFIKLKFVKNNLAKLIEKKCRELACGKVTAKAKYQYIAVCPISYLNWAMYHDQKENGLQAGEFYSGDCDNRDIRTIARNPLCAYSEVHNVTFVKNKFLDNWLSSCRELIYFNQKSDILALMSSADTDGDACTVIDSELIKNAVVLPQDGKYFINVDDGKKEEMEYTPENRFLATYRASGNLIGSIALKAANINSDSQQTLDYYDTINDKFILLSDIEIEDKEEKNAYIKGKLDSKEWLTIYEASEQHREHIKQRFYENEKDIYTALYNAMVSIDAPKTLYFPSSADMKVINEKYYKKAMFLQYKESKEDVNPSEYKYTFGLLDSASGVIKKHLLDEIDKVKSEFTRRADIIQQKLINGDYNEDEYFLCVEGINELYKQYTNEREAVDKSYSSKKRKQDKIRFESTENGSWDVLREEEYCSTVSKLKAEKYSKFKEIDVKYIALSDLIMNKYDMPTIANALGNLNNCTEDFVINLFYPVFSYLNDKLKPFRYVFKKADDGEITYLHERYKKISVEAIDNVNIVKDLHLEEKKRLKVIDVKANVRAFILDQSVIELIQTELKSKGHIQFDVRLNNGKVRLSKDDKDMFDVFDKHVQIDKYSLLNCSNLKVEILSNVKTKSAELTVTEIVG